ncbi:MAG: hypothetical protein KC503_35945, partial [Myxococcales bacterium]|nr:hypothetical protein [Myxococcales bacterium]
MNRLHAPLLLAVALAACTPPSAKRAEHALSRGDYAEARRAIEGGLQKSPDSGDLRALELRLLIADDKRTEAVTRYRKRPSSSLRFAFAESVIWYALRHRDPAIRLRAIHAVRGADAITLLRDIARRLDDPDGVVRSWAAVALSTEPLGAETLQKQLHSTDAKARAVAVGELGRIARGAALDTVARYASDSSARVRA